MKILFSFCCLMLSVNCYSQLKKVDLYDLVKKLAEDSSQYSSVGDWAVGKPLTFPVKWEADKIEMSDDEKINFFRKGTANIIVNGIAYNDLVNKPIKWNVMLKGPRSGFTSFSIASGSNAAIKAKTPIDSLFGKKPYTYKLLQDCFAGASSGFYFYEVVLPKKVISFIKISWNCNGGKCTLMLDCYNYWSKQYAALACGK